MSDTFLVRALLPLVLTALWSSTLTAQTLTTQPPQSSPPLTVEVGETSVIVRGAPPDSRLLLFSLAQEIEHYLTTLTRREVLLTSEGVEAIAVFRPDRPVAPQSIWAAVELDSGRVAVAVAPGLPSPDLSLPSGSTLPIGDSLTLELREVEIVVIRPGVGAWTDAISDGGVRDLDREADGRLRAGLETLRTIQGAPPPEALATGDVVLAIDPVRLRYAVLTPQSRGGESS